MKSIKLSPYVVRRYPDPFNRFSDDAAINIEHFVAVVPAKNLPEGIPLDPNPRAQRIDKGIYKLVQESLLRENDPTFLLKNKGITIICHSAEVSEDKKDLLLHFKDGEGIVDGGHTYKIIQSNKEECPLNQFVKLEVLTGLPRDFFDDIADGLNTAVQVQAMSLANLREEFQGIKEALKDQPYFDQIAFKENEEGKYDARDIVALMTAFNIGLYPESSGMHPKAAYISKSKCLEDFLKEENKESFVRLHQILPDILVLHDYMHLHAHELYNRKYKGKGKALAFFQNRKRGTYYFPFAQEHGDARIFDGALYPMLAAFRYLVELKPGEFFYSWKPGSLESVIKCFEAVGGDLINITKNTSDSKGKNPNAIGKDENHWAFLYQTVAFAFMQFTTSKV